MISYRFDSGLRHQNSILISFFATMRVIQVRKFKFFVDEDTRLHMVAKYIRKVFARQGEKTSLKTPIQQTRMQTFFSDIKVVYLKP